MAMCNTLLLLAALMLATLPVVTFFDGVPGGWARHAFQFYLVTVIFLFFGWFWVHGGQTLGMRSWRLQLVGARDTSVGCKTALLRFVAAIFSGLAAGMGYWWVLLDKKTEPGTTVLPIAILFCCRKRRRYKYEYFC